MKFKHYLNEKGEEIIDSIEEFNDVLHKKCKPYLQLIKPFKEPLQRGMHIFSKMGIKDVRQNREPLGTNSRMFKKLNLGLQQNGHNRRNKSFMVSAKSDLMFGDSYLVFPMGKFSYTWIKSIDVNNDDDLTGGVRINIRPYDFEADQWNPDINPVRKLIKYNIPFSSFFVTDKDINKAITNNYEIWFNCKQYLFIRYDGRVKGNNKLQIIEEI